MSNEQPSMLETVKQKATEFVNETIQNDTSPAPGSETTKGSEKTIRDSEQVGDRYATTEINGAQPNIIK
ncbi:protein of unknown function [Taphrina deformans PYCC 5710]|uniref:Uncharacterized protein n=1 Tax=Taphrina deformans (strain PYCC 5710 / ATCC 11124 / CBS 356.35 / IMI 108563 / JCM 9778 / NBRC 8474) TaxID=1097556 RepID=R4XD52_TAPDE|nr:protein of unknown function [Taphrina deformans PYCC 5710]|eukprot:CCG83750.1 protein of unknown function [Taphrina deformans PYCC 5710]